MPSAQTYAQSVGKIAPAPLPVLLVPYPLEPAHHVRRQTAGRFLAHQRRHRRAHPTRRYPARVQPRNRGVETRAAANVRRHQGRAKRHRRPRAAAQLRNFDLHRANPRQDLPARKVAVANHPPPSVRQPFVREPRQTLLELRRHRRLDQPSRARARQLRQRALNHRWRRQRNHFIVAHVWRAPLAKIVFSQLDFSRDTPHNSTHPYTTFDHSSELSRTLESNRSLKRSERPLARFVDGVSRRSRRRCSASSRTITFQPMASAYARIRGWMVLCSERVAFKTRFNQAWGTFCRLQASNTLATSTGAGSSFQAL